MTENPLAVANYFIEKSFETGEIVTPMKVLKLVYIAHGWHLAYFPGEPLINEAVQAWKYGPVIESVYHTFKQYGSGPITAQMSVIEGYGYVTPQVKDDVNKMLLERIWEVYGKYSGIHLSSLTHQKDTPWDIVFNQLKGHSTQGAIIPNEIIEEHYRKKLAASKATA